MQNALSDDVNAETKAVQSRDEALQVAEAQPIDLDVTTVDYEEIVNESTGEVSTHVQTASETAPQSSAEDAPGY